MNQLDAETLIENSICSKVRTKRVKRLWKVLSENTDCPYFTSEGGMKVYVITRKELAKALKMDWDGTTGSSARTLTEDIKLLDSLKLIERLKSDNQIQYIIRSASGN
jgi:hypothetical protein